MKIIIAFLLCLILTGCASDASMIKEHNKIWSDYQSGIITKEQYDSKYSELLKKSEDNRLRDEQQKRSLEQLGQNLALAAMYLPQQQQNYYPQATPASFQATAVRMPDGSVMNYGNRQVNAVNSPDGSVIITPVKKQYNEYDVYDNYGNKVGQAKQR